MQAGPCGEPEEAFRSEEAREYWVRPLVLRDDL